MDEMESQSNNPNVARAAESVRSSMYGQEEDAYSEIVAENENTVHSNNQSYDLKKSKEARDDIAKADNIANLGFQSNV